MMNRKDSTIVSLSKGNLNIGSVCDFSDDQNPDPVADISSSKTTELT